MFPSLAPPVAFNRVMVKFSMSSGIFKNSNKEMYFKLEYTEEKNHKNSN